MLITKHKRHKNRFSLIELLVVIAIIAILSSLLFPALRKAQETAKKIHCANNQKQIHVALFNYINDYDDYIPRMPVWTWSLAPYLGSKYTFLNYKPGEISKEWRLACRSDFGGPFICPSTTAPGTHKWWEGDYNGEPICSSYGPTLRYTYEADVNTRRWGGWQYSYTGDATRGLIMSKKLNQVTPNSVILIEKLLWKVGGIGACAPYDFNKAVCTDIATYPQNTHQFWHYGPRWRHLNTANFLFIDGHVSPYRMGKQIFNVDWQVK